MQLPFRHKSITFSTSNPIRNRILMDFNLKAQDFASDMRAYPELHSHRTGYSWMNDRRCTAIEVKLSMNKWKLMR